MSKKETTITKEVDNNIYFPFGHTLVDLVVNGFPGKLGLTGGKFHGIVGESASGKTFLANELIANCRKIHGKKFKWNYDDCEYGNTMDDNKLLYKHEIIDENTKISKTVQEMHINIVEFINSIKSDERGLYVVDSLDGIMSSEAQARVEDKLKKERKKKEAEEKTGTSSKKESPDKKGSYNLEKHKYLKQEFFPTVAGLLFENKNCIVFFVTQLTTNLNASMFEQKTIPTGGKALHYWCHSRLLVKSGEVKKRTVRGRELDYSVKATVKPIKIKAPRHRTCYATTIFDYGSDDLGDSIDFIYGLNTDTGKTSPTKRNKITFEDKEYSKDELIAYIDENNREEDIKKMIIDMWEADEESIRTKRKPRF